jgi:hypothetical protein
MAAKWNVVFQKESGDVIVGSFTNKKEAQEEIEYRYTLCRHLGYSPNITVTCRSYQLQKNTSIK